LQTGEQFFYSDLLHPGSILATLHHHKNTNVITLTKDNDITCISEILNFLTLEYTNRVGIFNIFMFMSCYIQVCTLHA